MREPDDGRGDSPAAPAADRAPSVPFSPHAILNRVFLLLFVLALVFLWSLRVTKSGRVLLPFSDAELPDTCRQLLATGKPCPSCGATRSFVYALHGDLDRSREYHRAGIPIAAMLVAQVLMRIVFLDPRRRSAAVDVLVSGGMLIAFAVLLN